MTALANGPLHPEDVGPEAVDVTTVTIDLGVDPSFADGAIPVAVADLYVPQSGGPRPTVVISEGFCNTKEAFSGWGNRLASRGFVVLVPNRRAVVESLLPGGAGPSLDLAISQLT